MTSVHRHLNPRFGEIWRSRGCGDADDGSQYRRRFRFGLRSGGASGVDLCREFTLLRGKPPRSGRGWREQKRQRFDVAVSSHPECIVFDVPWGKREFTPLEIRAVVARSAKEPTEAIQAAVGA